jgi:flagellin-like protein
MRKKKLLRNRRALSPVFSTILLIMIVVIGMTVVFAFFVNYVKDYQTGSGSSVFEAAQIEDVWFKSATTSKTVPRNPSSYNLIGGTSGSGTIGDLASSNNVYMSFGSYASGFTPKVYTPVDQIGNVDGISDIGTHSNFNAEKAKDGSYDTLTEAKSGTTEDKYYPSGYNLLNSTTWVSGSVGNLTSNDGVYMQFRSYASAYSGTTNFGQTSVGGSSSGLSGYARGNRFTCTTAGSANSISAYLSFTASSGTLGNTNTGTSGETIVNTIRGQRFTPTATVEAQSIAAYLDVPAAPTLGNTAQESSTASLEDTIRGSSFTASASGTIQSISAYISRSITFGTPTINAAIYNEGAHTLLAQATAQSVDSGTSWLTFTFASPPSLTAGNSYVLVVWASSSSWYSINLYYSSSGGTNQGHSVSATYGSSFPSSPSFSHNTYRYSIYCTYTQSANVKAAIYADSSPATPIATTSPGTVTDDGWVTFAFLDPEPILTASTNYDLVVWAESGSINVNLNRSSTTGGNGRYATSTYGDWPSFITFSTNAYQYSIYCNYQTTAKAQCAIYSSTGGSRLGTTDEVILTDSTGSWVTFPFTTKPVLSASTQYILAMMTDNSNVNYYYASSGGEYYRTSATYPNWPTSISSYSSVLVSIYCTVQSASEYTCEVEFTGSSNSDPWTQLGWTVDSAWTTASVPTTLQLYNYNAGTYPTSGDGYIAYTSSATPNTDELKTSAITTNPTYFRDATGNWKLKITGVKTTTTQFDCKVDLVEYKATSGNNYMLDLEAQWTNAPHDETDEYLCIYTGTLDASERLDVDVRYGSNWVSVFNQTNQLQPNQWNNVTVSNYLTGSTFTIRFKGSSETGDKIQSSWNIDCTLLYTGNTPTQYTCEVEFTGSSDNLDWTGLDWTVECGWTNSGVSVTLQLYDWTAGQYPTSGDGYISYTSGAAGSDQTQYQNITANPTAFRSPTDQTWKVKIKGVKSTQFNCNVDWIEFYPKTKENPIEIWLYNYGKIDTTISTVYINNLLVDSTSPTIQIGSHTKLTAYLPTTWTTNTNYHIRIVTARGSAFEGEYLSPS